MNEKWTAAKVRASSLLRFHFAHAIFLSVSFPKNYIVRWICVRCDQEARHVPILCIVLQTPLQLHESLDRFVRKRSRLFYVLFLDEWMYFFTEEVCDKTAADVVCGACIIVGQHSWMLASCGASVSATDSYIGWVSKDVL